MSDQQPSVETYKPNAARVIKLRYERGAWNVSYGNHLLMRTDIRVHGQVVRTQFIKAFNDFAKEEAAKAVEAREAEIVESFKELQEEWARGKANGWCDSTYADGATETLEDTITIAKGEGNP